MILKIFGSFLISSIIGYLWISLFNPDFLNKNLKSLKIFFSIGAGMGISSLFAFIWLNMAGDLYYYPVFECITAIILAFLVFIKRTPSQKQFIHGKKQTQSGLSNSISYIFLVLFGISIFTGLLLFIFISFNMPYGETDAFAIWNGKARFFFLSENFHWLDLFKKNITIEHIDYPLLLPVFVAKNWTYAGQESILSPMLTSFTFILITTGSLFSSLNISKNRLQSIVGGIILASTPFFIVKGTHQIADIPLSFYVLATIILLYLESSDKEKNNFLPLIGITSALAAWCKNEGILFLLCVIFYRFIIFVKKREFHLVKKDFFSYLSGAAPILIVIAYFKIFLAPETDIFANQRGVSTLFSKIFDPSRYLLTARKFFNFAVEDIIYKYVSLLLVAFPFINGIKIEKNYKTGLKICFSILVTVLAGYFAVYIISPNNLTWHINTSLGRLLLHLLPAAVFVYFCSLKPINFDNLLNKK